MLLDAVIIILRETLEAGVLVSLLLTIAHRFHLGARWLFFALATGLVGAGVYAASLATVSTWFDDVGQEVINAAMQYGIYLSLLAISLLISLVATAKRRFLAGFLMLTVVLAVVREGAEITVFFTGYLQNEDVLSRALTGGFVGLMLGLSAGALCYYVIVSLSPTMERRIQHVMLALMAAGMVGQATQLLIQADWLPSTMPLWDTGGWLSERSVAGEIAYAIFGYEATPTPVEVGFYSVALALIPLSVMLCRHFGFNARQEV